MNLAIRYQNSVIGDLLSIMTTDDILEFAVELNWLRDCVGDTEFLQIKKELESLRDMPWRNALRVALQNVVPGARIEVDREPQLIS